MAGSILKAVAAVFLCVSFLLGSSPSKAETLEIPLMGRGSLAILSSSENQVQLANLETAVLRDGVLYFDQHARLADKRVAGDPNQREFVFRIKLDCNEMRSKLVSAITQNYHTLGQVKEAEGVGDLSELSAVSQSSLHYDICAVISNGGTAFEALAQNHYFEMSSFPDFALSMRDAFILESVNEAGEVTKVSESELLLYLREHNPNF